MRLTIAYSKLKMRNLVLINNDTYQRETVSGATHSTTLKACYKAKKILCMFPVVHPKTAMRDAVFKFFILNFTNRKSAMHDLFY